MDGIGHGQAYQVDRATTHSDLRGARHFLLSAREDLLELLADQKVLTDEMNQKDSDILQRDQEIALLRKKREEEKSSFKEKVRTSMETGNAYTVASGFMGDAAVV